MCRRLLYAVLGLCFGGVAATAAVGSANSAVASIYNITGLWKPLNGDDRLMTVKSDKDKVTIEAHELSCTLTDLRSEMNNSSAAPSSVTAKSLCHDESDIIYAEETLTLLRVGREVFLIDATVALRHVNEYSDPKVDEAYTNKPANITIYRKVHSR